MTCKLHEKCCTASVQKMLKHNTFKGSVIDSPEDGGRRGSLGMAGQDQALPFVQGYITWQLFEDGPCVD